MVLDAAEEVDKEVGMTEKTKEDIKPQEISMTLLITILVVTIGSLDHHCKLGMVRVSGVMTNSQDTIMEYFHDQGKEQRIFSYSVDYDRQLLRCWWFHWLSLGA